MAAMYAKAALLLALAAYVALAEEVEKKEGCAAFQADIKKLTQGMDKKCLAIMDNGLLKPLLAENSYQPNHPPYRITEEDAKLLCEDATCALKLTGVRKALNETGCLFELGKRRAEGILSMHAAQARTTPQQYFMQLQQYSARAGRPAPSIDAMATRHARQMVASSPLFRLDRGWACAKGEQGKYCVARYSEEAAKIKSAPLEPTPEDAVVSLCKRMKDGGCCLVGGKTNELANGITVLMGMLYARQAAPTVLQTQNATTFGKLTYADMCGALGVDVPTMPCKPNNDGSASPGN